MFFAAANRLRTIRGVMFTVDPISQYRGRLLIEGAYGLGEVVVGGVEPDTYFVARPPDPSNTAVTATACSSRRWVSR